MNKQKKLYRSLDDRVMAGVCGGIAEYLNLDPVIIRVVWLLLTLFGGSGIIAYVIGIFIIPEAPGLKEPRQRSKVWFPIIILVSLFIIVQHGYFFQMLWNQFWEFSGSWFISALFLAAVIYFLTKNKPELFKKSKKQDIRSTLCLSNTDKKISGVCGGIAELLNLDSTLIRFAWVFGTIVSGGIGVILYIALVFILPSKQAAE